MLSDLSLLEEVLSVSCTVCYNKYDRDEFKPSTLVCGHTLCIGCAKNSEKCPTCKTSNPGKIDEFGKSMYELQPNYEMMNMIDNNQKIRVNWIDEKVKKQSPKFWREIKTKQEELAEFSEMIRKKYEKIEKEMNDQKEMVENYYRAYMDDWRTNYQLLAYSKKRKENLISELGKMLEDISSPEYICKMIESKTCTLEDYIPHCKQELEKYRAEESDLKSSDHYISLVPPTFDTTAVKVLIYRSADDRKGIPLLSNIVESIIGYK